MLRRALAGLVLAVLSSALPIAQAAWRPVPGGWASGAVEWVGNVPIEGGAMGGRLHGNLLVVTTLKSFSLYDVTEPLLPVLLSNTPLGAQTYNEQPQTNGKIVLLTKNGTLDIFDIQNPRLPVRVAAFADPRNNHIWTCVLDCRYAYGGRGTILDLADPSSPQIIGDWSRQVDVDGYHTVREVAPGVVLTGSAPMYLLDARQNPAIPLVAATAPVEQTTPKRPFIIIGTPRSLPADVHWPLAASDRYALAATETAEGGNCDETSGSFYSYDTAGWEQRGTFVPVDEFQILENGTYTNGAPPAHVLGCSAYAFDPRPSYGSIREVAVAWFEHGTRLLRIDDQGQIREVGGFVGAGSITVQPIWRNEDTLYALDAARGLEILHVAPTMAGAQLEDPPGDANATTAGSTGPISVQTADLVSIRYETTWIDEPVGEDGIRRVPTGLRLRLRTRAAPTATGPTILYGLEASLGSCPGAFSVALRGPAAAPSDPPDRQVRWERDGTACPGGTGVSTPAAWTASVDLSRREVVLSLPFAALTPSEAQLLRPGTALRSPLGVTAIPAIGASGPRSGALDRTDAGADWTIGSDVPPDVPCTRGCPEG